MSNLKNELIVKSTEFLTEAMDLTLVEIIKRYSGEGEVLKNIPIIKWGYLTLDLYNNFQLARFLKKYAHFLGPIDKEFIDNKEIQEKLTNILKDEKERSKLIENTIIAITSYQTEFKTKILGILFVKTFKYQIFSIEEYNILLFSLENIHPVIGFSLLEKYYLLYKQYIKSTTSESKTTVHIEIANLDYFPLSTSGLLNLPKGGAYSGDVGGAFISPLGIKFYENCILNSE
ncbi:hypothetical protein EHQ46_16130 [Leptospira yanagawae]|uniref:DUF4393 domain-containing protein n=1 Tax=Leptospira yanagawae TaxID=293069 RepID=A0ABY2LXV4_9LEPT|nr:hypothetical protein [Leptospira yanagawae]TGL17715.1 hypothetical protein EHQ46_16130 [Leptospira yanagawae]